MLIRDLLLEKGRNVETIEADQTIHSAIQRLNRHRIGALVVTGDHDEVVGIITERDILMVCGNRCAHLSEPPTEDEADCLNLVRYAMTRDVVIGVPSDDLNYAMGVMTKNRIRHLPIVRDGKLEGIVSIGDLVNACWLEAADENQHLKDYIQGRVG